MSDIREGVQEEAKQAYLNLSSPRKATIIAGTGAGKSKVAIDIIKELKPISILLLTNSENLRDNNWKAEFEKFGWPWESVVSECYQTVHRWQDTRFDLVIADEIDFAMSPIYSRYFEKNSWGNLLGLTGFATEDKKGLLQLYAPVCYEMSTQQMQEDGLLNKSEFIFVEFDLDIAKTIKVPKKAGGFFMNSENDAYKYYDTEFTKAMIIKTSIEKKMKLFGTEDTSFKNADFKFKMMAAKRKSVLNNLDSSIKVVKNLVSTLRVDEKVLIFCALTKQADKLGYPTYHGDEDISTLNMFNDGDHITLTVCKKLNRGVNLNGVTHMIKESFDGSETDFQQQHGRLMRLRPDQTAKIIVLVSYFKSMVKKEEKGLLGQSVVRMQMMRQPTQARRWAEKMMASFKNVTGRTIVMTKDYKLPEGITL